MSKINILDNQPQTLSYNSLHINQSKSSFLALIIAGPTFILPHLDELHCIPLFHKSKSNETDNIAISSCDITIKPQETQSLQCNVLRQIDFMALQSRDFDPTTPSMSAEPPSPLMDCLGLFYKIDENILAHTNIPHMNQIVIIKDRIHLPIINKGNTPLHIAWRST